MQPVILFIIIFIGNIITVVILPIITVSTVIGIVSNISDKVQIGKISKFLKSSVVWVLGTAITIFVGVLSLEGTLTSSVDGLSAKGIKAVAANVIPVLGKALSDSVDTVLGCTILLKNAVGVVGMLVLVSICIMPIIKLSVLTISYNLTTAIAEPIADKRIVKLLEQITGTFKLLLAVTFFVSILLIIGLALTLKISNAGMMYR
ncbi:MAG: stage III sporulation protein AE [Clostridia bacterium]|nr:stage III sporulation protein AE [Clostridia bacterium]